VGNTTNRLVGIILFLGTILVSFNHCLGPTQIKKSGLTFDSSTTGTTGDDSGISILTPPTTGTTDQTAVSIQAFATTMHPITQARCVNCHGSFQTPLHAVADPTQAHNAVIDGFKVNFNNIPSSRMVLKLSDESHNCWSDCNANAAEMQAAIEDWKDQIDAATGGVTPEPTTPSLTTAESRTFMEELDPENAMSVGDIVIEANSASLKAPMVAAAAGADTYIHVPNGNGGNLANNNNAAGSGYINFDIAASDNYKVYAYVDAPGNADNSFHIKVNNSPYAEWHIPQTTGFEWREVMTTAAGNPVNFFIPAGNGNILEVRQREDGTKISKVVISSDPNINLNDIGSAVESVVTFDLSPILGVPATLSVEVSEYDMYSYKLSNPTITSNFRIRIKDLKPLINGQYNPQHATYTLIDTATVMSGATVLSTRSLIALKDQGNDIDRLSFSFEILEVQ
jgi:hypothetical protein